jgi:chromosome segregation ATPase
VEHLEQLIIDLKESLEREMRTGFGRLETRLAGLENRFDTQAARLDRHAGLLQTGNRWLGRMHEWADKVDQALETKDRQIAELLKRLEKLEGRNGKPAE